MRNLRYFTFERNKYFYGKLLSVGDFESEQRYMNDKRRIINRFIHGTGVVCGMNVVPIDDITISVEMGLALDFAGREIMLEHPVIKKLSAIDGFDEYTEQDEENSQLYLCIEYDEEEREPVHSIAGSKSANDSKLEYNKYAEGYHLYLTSQEPESEDLSVAALYEETKTIYRGNGVCIKQTVPKYVQGNQEFEIKISVESTGQQKLLSFQYDLKGSCIQGDDVITVSFDEKEAKTLKQEIKRYEFTRKLKTNAVTDVTAKLSVVEDSFQLKIGDVPVNAKASGSNSIHIIAGNVKKEIIDRYYRGAMEDIVKNAYQQSIYLAKISVIRTGSTYMIDAVESMPFSQYLYNNSLAAVMDELSMKEEKNKQQLVLERENSYPGLSNMTNGGVQIATGTAVLELGIGGAVGQKFFSEEISHGLGLGTINIVLGEACEQKDNGNILFGSTSIFDEDKASGKVEMAAKVNVEKGTFVIGVRCLTPTSESKLKIHWIAIKDGTKQMLEKQETIMQIKPNMMNLSIRETYYFEALIGGSVESRVKWSVREADGGTIDENGMYTAPNKAGVYEIIGESMDQPQYKASTFVVVRDV